MTKAFAFSRSMNEGVHVITGKDTRKIEWKQFCGTGGELETDGQSLLGSFRDRDILTAMFCCSHFTERGESGGAVENCQVLDGNAFSAVDVS